LLASNPDEREVAKVVDGDACRPGERWWSRSCARAAESEDASRRKAIRRRPAIDATVESADE
jgi:hypothetical protein